MDKFGRNYTLGIGPKVQGVTGVIAADQFILTVTLPFTIEFDIIRNTLTSANVCQIRLYNLSEKNRNLIRYNNSNYGQYQPIVLRAGYGATNLPVIFSGNISAAWSVREGVNFITQIECYDGGFAFINGGTSVAFPKGINQQTVIKTLAGSLPFVTLGAVGDYPGQLTRGNSYNGNTAEILRDLTGGGFFVDGGKANALGNDEYIAATSGTTIINSATGLLNTPLLETNTVRFDMVFEPGLNVGHKILLNSSTEMNFNGEYKVIGVKHRGMISDAVCGSVITTGDFSYSKQLIGVLQ